MAFNTSICKRFTSWATKFLCDPPLPSTSSATPKRLGDGYPFFGFYRSLLPIPFTNGSPKTAIDLIRYFWEFTSQYINKQIKINAVTLTHKDFSELFRATNEQLLIRFRNYWATQQQQKRTVKRRYYKNLIVVFSYRILSFFTFTPPIQNTPRWTVNIWTNEHWGIVQMN